MPSLNHVMLGTGKPVTLALKTHFWPSSRTESFSNSMNCGLWFRGGGGLNKILRFSQMEFGILTFFCLPWRRLFKVCLFIMYRRFPFLLYDVNIMGFFHVLLTCVHSFLVDVNDNVGDGI